MQTVECTKIIVANRFRKDMGDLASLAASIEEVGLLHPVVVTADFRLIAGERRLRACMEVLKWKHIPVRTLNIEHLIRGEFAENEVRKEFTVSERVAIGKAIEKLLGERRGRPSKEPNEAPKDAPAETDGEIVAILPQLNPGEKSRQTAAKQAGFSGARTYEKAKKAVAYAEPEVVRALDEGKVSVSDAASVIKEPAAAQRKAVKDVEAGKSATLNGSINKARVSKEKREPGDDSYEVRQAFKKVDASWGAGLREAVALAKTLGDKPMQDRLVEAARPFTELLNAWKREALG